MDEPKLGGGGVDLRAGKQEGGGVRAFLHLLQSIQGLRNILWDDDGEAQCDSMIRQKAGCEDEAMRTVWSAEEVQKGYWVSVGQIIAIRRGNCIGYFLRSSPLIKDDGRSDSRPAAAPAAIRRSLPSINSPSAHGQARTRRPRAPCPSGCRGGRALCFSLRQRTLLLLCPQCL